MWVAVVLGAPRGSERGARRPRLHAALQHQRHRRHHHGGEHGPHVPGIRRQVRAGPEGRQRVEQHVQDGLRRRRRGRGDVRLEPRGAAPARPGRPCSTPRCTGVRTRPTATGGAAARDPAARGRVLLATPGERGILAGHGGHRRPRRRHLAEGRLPGLRRRHGAGARRGRGRLHGRRRPIGDGRGSLRRLGARRRLSRPHGARPQPHALRRPHLDQQRRRAAGGRGRGLQGAARGPVHASLGEVAYEGDRSLGGDSAAFDATAALRRPEPLDQLLQLHDQRIAARPRPGSHARLRQPARLRRRSSSTRRGSCATGRRARR